MHAMDAHGQVCGVRSEETLTQVRYIYLKRKPRPRFPANSFRRREAARENGGLAATWREPALAEPRASDGGRGERSPGNGSVWQFVGVQQLGSTRPAALALASFWNVPSLKQTQRVAAIRKVGFP